MKHVKYTFVIYAVEQGRNRDRRDVCDLWLFSQFLGMIFSAVNFKANKNFVLVTKNAWMVSLISVVFFFHVNLIW